MLHACSRVQHPVLHGQALRNPRETALPEKTANVSEFWESVLALGESFFADHNLAVSGYLTSQIATALSICWFGVKTLPIMTIRYKDKAPMKTLLTGLFHPLYFLILSWRQARTCLLAWVRAPCILVQRWGTMLQLRSIGNIDSVHPCTGSVNAIARAVKRLILNWYSADVQFLSLDQNQSTLQFQLFLGYP